MTRTGTMRTKVDFQTNSEDIEAIVGVAMGLSPRTVAKMVGFGDRVGKVTYRQKRWSKLAGQKSNLSCIDFRTMKPGTMGGDLAKKLFTNGVKKSLEVELQRRCSNVLPTKAEARKGAGGINSRVVSAVTR